VKRERNVRIDGALAVVAIAAGVVFRISRIEWALVVLCIGAVLATEIANAALEAVVDLASPREHPLAARAKDLAAAASLVMALAALVVGLLIFVPKIIRSRGL
jgi:diacylglycerol kinase